MGAKKTKKSADTPEEVKKLREEEFEEYFHDAMLRVWNEREALFRVNTPGAYYDKFFRLFMIQCECTVEASTEEEVIDRILNKLVDTITGY